MDTRFLSTYYQELQKKMVGPKKEKEIFLEGLKDNVSTFLDSCPDATEEDLYANFGTPEDLAEEFIASLPEKDSVRAKVRNARIAIVAGIIVAAVVVGLLAFFVADAWNFNHGYVVVGPVNEGVYSPPPDAFAIY